MSSNKKNTYIFLGKVIFITLLIVLFVRSFIIGSLSVSSSQMETTLHDGDKILINKTAYGIRLPITLLSIPFTFDHFGKYPSYSSAIQMPYHRLFTKEIERNDIVIFNHPQEIEKPLDKRSLLLSRCVALPGDTIELRNNIFFINGQKYEISPNGVQEYWIKNGDRDQIESIANENDIPILDMEKRADTLFMHLSKYDAYILNESIQDTIQQSHHSADTTRSYKIMLPAKGQTVHMNESNTVIYKQIILQEHRNENVEIKNGKLLINNIQQNIYTFKDSYYWMLSDNKPNSIDSRTIGFIPFSSVIGEASYIWYRPTSDGSYKKICFLPIK